MKIKQLIAQHAIALTDKYAHQLLPGHRKALDAILACRSHCGEYIIGCKQCQSYKNVPLSCGHRSCPQCQSHLGTLWLERQKQKLLPVNYFMVTFTLPQELRSVAWRHQSVLYDLLFKAAAEAIKTIGINNHNVKLAMTGVLHTHKRDKGYHPHVHFIVPGGGLTSDGKNTFWKPLANKFLINEFALAQVFRGIFLHLLFSKSIALPNGLPKKWVAHIDTVGKGDKALAYLSRYLYRGVISEEDIQTNNNGQVTFQYRNSKTNQIETKTLPPEDFLWRILQHVLPRGFRRVRDFGFLHANAQLQLKRIQLLLRVNLPKKKPIKQVNQCKVCDHNLDVVMVLPKRIPMKFSFYRILTKVKPPI